MLQEPLINIQDLSFHYHSAAVLENISLQIYAEDYLAVIGPNGGGKTTLLKLILGLLTPSGGTIQVLGTDAVTGRSKIGYLPQHHQNNFQYPISVMEFVLMGRLNQGCFHRYNQSDIAAAEAVLKKVDVHALKSRHFSQLSGGEKQRVLLARTLVSDPQLLLLDEPTTGFDHQSERCFYEILKDLNQKIPILMVSHDISAVSKYVKTIACLNKHLIYHGSKSLMPKDIEETYCCHVDLIAHGVPHRVLGEHGHS